MTEHRYIGKHDIYRHAFELLLEGSSSRVKSLWQCMQSEPLFEPALMQDVCGQRKALKHALNELQSADVSLGVVIPSIVISAEQADESSLDEIIERCGEHFGFPLQVRDNDFNSLHRHFPVRRPKNIVPTAHYFQTQIIESSGDVCIERMYNDGFDYAAVIRANNQQETTCTLFGLSLDHGVLQEVFEDKTLLTQAVFSSQIRRLIDLVINCFHLSDCTFTLYFTAYQQHINFSHINMSVDLPQLLLLWKMTNDSQNETYATARLVYKPINPQKLFTQSDKKRVTDDEKHSFAANKPAAQYLALTQKKEAQLDKPFGVTMAQELDVRQSLRQAIRYENVLTGRLDRY